MVSVLVTGGAGFVGSHTCKLLATKGFLPVTFDSLENGHREAVRWGPLIVGDIRDKRAIQSALADYKVDAVFHFAALAYVGDSVIQPDRYYDVNTVGTHSLLAAMREASVDRIVFSSSCATYGIPQNVPIDEKQPQRPINPYGRTKLIGEQMIFDYAAAYGMRYAVLRYFNAAGCDSEGDLYEKHLPETHLIPRALLAAGGYIQSLELFGTDYETSDGTAIRDYVHVTDLAIAHWLAFTRLSAGASPFAVNLGTGSGYSVKTIVDMVERVTGRPVPIKLEGRRSGDPPALIAATGLSATLIGFAPQHSDLENIVRTAWRGIQAVYGPPLTDLAVADDVTE